jgi:flagellar biogenesis protein FliO
MHSTANATFNYLPLLPEFVGQLTTFLVFLGLIFAVTLVVVALYGAKRLSR